MKDLDIQGLRDVIYREITVRQSGQQIDFPLHRVGGAKERANASEPAMIGDLGSEFRRSSSCAHPGEYDRHVDTQEVAKARPKHNSPP
jgi:hypothetical protein